MKEEALPGYRVLRVSTSAVYHKDSLQRRSCCDESMTGELSYRSWKTLAKAPAQKFLAPFKLQ